MSAKWTPSIIKATSFSPLRSAASSPTGSKATG
jgi:hypothetical protein